MTRISLHLPDVEPVGPAPVPTPPPPGPPPVSDPEPPTGLPSPVRDPYIDPATDLRCDSW